MRRLPVTAFALLVVATIAAFFVTQHLKVSTPLLAGYPAPYPAAINPVDGHVCKGVSHRSMLVSFYLLNRSDDVDVYIVDRNQTIVDALASGVHMIAGRHPRRHRFVWNGRTSNGSVAPDGIYYIRVSLIHQGRSVLISNNAGALLPVTVETVGPQPRVTSVTPDLIPRAGLAGATIRYTGNRGTPGLVLVYRSDLPGPPRLVKSFAARRGGSTRWDGTLAHSVPAHQGTYLIGLKVTDKACNTGVFPAEHPPLPGTTAHAGVTVRYLAALPPLEPVAAGASATVYVDARQHSYAWALRAAGTKKVLGSGRSRAFALRVPVPSEPGAPGLYELALRYGSHRTQVPLIGAPAGGAARARVLVVLPALTWQGLNPVDDDGDGIPNTLSAGYPILLARPLVDGLPAGWGSETGLIKTLRQDHLSYALTTDLALLAGTGPGLAGHAGVVLAGDERWIPPALATALRGYVSTGGHVLSIGVDSLRRSVTVVAGRARNPSGPRAADIFGAHPAPLVATRGSFILAGKDQLKLFTGTSGAFRGFPAYQPFTSVTPPLTIASAAGTTTGSSAIIGFRLGRGIVIEVGIPDFGAALARKFDAQQILSRIWTVLSR